MEDLEETLERKRHLLTLASGLADGGARVRMCCCQPVCLALAPMSTL